MNCKPGDLAFVVKSAAGNEGLVVTVLGPGYFNPHYGFLWVVRTSRPTACSHGFAGREHFSPDAWLRPLRGPSADQVNTDDHIRNLETI